MDANGPRVIPIALLWDEVDIRMALHRQPTMRGGGPSRL